MARRGKIVIARINEEKKRKTTMKKREKGLLKKVGELTTLCDIEAAVVIYNPGENQPIVWPNTSEARATISKYLRKSEQEQLAHSYNTNSFTAEKLRKMKDRAQKLMKKNGEKYVQALLTSLAVGETRIQDLDSEQKEKLSTFVNQRKEQLRQYILSISTNEQAPPLPRAFPLPTMPPVSRAASALSLDSLGSARNFPPPLDVVGGKRMNFTGLKQVASPLLQPKSLDMSPIHLATNGLDMTRGRYAQPNSGGLMQNTVSSPLSLPPFKSLTVPPLHPVANGLYMTQNVSAGAFNGEGNLWGAKQYPLPSTLSLPQPKTGIVLPVHSATSGIEMADDSLINASTGTFIGVGDFGRTKQHHLPSVIHQQPPKPLSMLPVYSGANNIDMTSYSSNNASVEEILGDGSFGGTKQRCLPSPLHLQLSEPLLTLPVHSVANGLDRTDHSLINTNTVAFAGEGSFGRMKQHATLSNLPPTLPRGLGLPPMPALQLDESGLNLTSDEYIWNTSGFPAPAVAVFDDQFGTSYGA